jgi:hypothetical protein
MLNCKDATRLISEGLDHRLSMWQRMNLRLHVMMCGACSAYKRQIEGLHRIFGLRRQRAEGIASDMSSDAHRLSPAKREQIKHLLESQSPGHSH